MWDKIIEVLLNKYFQTSEQREEKRVKEKIVFLHEALVHCHSAYLQYKSNRSEENFVIWRRSVGYLIRVLEEVRTTLASFAPEAYDHAVDYAIGEIPLIPQEYQRHNLEAAPATVHGDLESPSEDQKPT